MSKLGKRLIAAAKEAVVIAQEGQCKFTPGPWSVSYRDGQPCVAGPATEWLAALPYAPCAGFGLTNVFEIGANARLIAAAPRLLAELQNMIDVYWGEGDGEEPPPDCIQRAQAAIGQALGNQSEASR